MIGGLISTVVMAVVLWMLAHSASKDPELDEGGSIIVSYPGAVEKAGIVLFIAGVGVVAVLGISWGVESRAEWVALVASLGLIALLTVPLIVEGRRRVTMSADGLAGYLLGGSPTSVGWEEVSAVRFSRWSGYLTVRSEDGRKIRVSGFMRGSAHLADMVQSLPDVEGAGEAVEAFHAYRRGYGM